MRNKKYQQGGVFDVKPIVPDVGSIAGVPRLEPPTVSPSSLPNVLSLLHNAEQRRYREEQRIAQEQARLGADQDQYFALRDSIFGEVHNEQQKKVLETAKAQYGVKDLDSLALDNPHLLKPQIKALRMLAIDDNVKKVLGQAEGASRIFQKVDETGLLTSDEAGAFNEMRNEYFQWTGGPDGKTPYPNDRLMAPLYNKPKETKQSDFDVVTGKIIPRHLGIDINDPQQRANFYMDAASSWYDKDAAGATKLGLITIDPNTGFPIPTDYAKKRLDAQWDGSRTTFGFKQEQDVKKFEEKKVISERFEEPEKTGKIKPSEDPKVVQSVWSDLVVIAKSKSIDLSGLDPNDPEVKPFLKVITTDGGSLTDSIDKIDDVAQELDTIKKRKEAEKLKGTYQDPFQALLNKAAQPAQDPATTVDPAPTAVKKVTPSFQSWKNKPK